MQRHIQDFPFSTEVPLILLNVLSTELSTMMPSAAKPLRCTVPFPSAAVTKRHKLEGSVRDASSQNCRGHKSRIKTQVGRTPPRAPGKNMPLPLPAPGPHHVLWFQEPPPPPTFPHKVTIPGPGVLSFFGGGHSTQHALLSTEDAKILSHRSPR